MPKVTRKCHPEAKPKDLANEKEILRFAQNDSFAVTLAHFERYLMKAVLIVHNAAMDEEVNEALESVGIDCYTKFPNTLGRGKASEPHLNTDVWPGINCGTFVVTDQSKAKKAMENVRRMREERGTEGIKAFMWEVDDIT